MRKIPLLSRAVFCSCIWNRYSVSLFKHSQENKLCQEMLLWLSIVVSWLCSCIFSQKGQGVLCRSRMGYKEFVSLQDELS